MSSQIQEPLPQTLVNPVARYLLVTRPPFLSASLVPVLLGLATAHYAGVTINPVTAVLTLIGAVLMNAAVNVLNDYYDALNGTDAGNTDRLYPFTGGSRFIQNGIFTTQQTARYGLLLMLMAALIGVVLALHSGPGLLVIGIIGLLIGWGYSAPPLRLNSRGLGELTVVLGFGVLIALGSDYVQRGQFANMPLLASIPYGLLVANLLYINQFPDRVADEASGKHHWVVRLGVKRAPWGYLLMVLLAYGLVLAEVVTGTLPAMALLALLPLPLSLVAARQLFRYAATPRHLVPAIRLTILAMLTHGALLSIAIAVAA